VAEDIRTAIKKIFRSCQRLTELTGRPFSPDGHLVGSFGEVAAADLLNLTLMPPSNDGYDAIDKQGRRVENKATTRASIGLFASGTKAERLVVVVIDGDGGTEIAYDGPAAPVWDAAGKPQKNGQTHARGNCGHATAALDLRPSTPRAPMSPHLHAPRTTFLRSRP